MESKQLTKHEAYKAAVAKDEAFEIALLATFGNDGPGDARYMPYWAMPEPAKTACLEYQAACEVLRKAV